jgi:hypothetical protein
MTIEKGCDIYELQGEIHWVTPQAMLIRFPEIDGRNKHWVPKSVIDEWPGLEKEWDEAVGKITASIVVCEWWLVKTEII